MKNDLTTLLLKFQNGDFSKLDEITQIFSPIINKMIQGENKFSHKTYYDTLLTNLILLIYDLNFNNIKNPKAYLKTCLYHSFLEFNTLPISTSIITDSIIDNIEDYTCSTPKLFDYLKILYKYLEYSDLKLLELNIIENKTVKDIAKLYKCSESNIYKKLEKMNYNLQNNNQLKNELQEIS